MGEALIVRRGGTGGGGGGSYTVTLTSLIPSGTETITYTGTASGTVNIVNGTGSVLLPTGTYTFTSSDTVWTSGTVAVTGNTSINCWYGTPVYWYGNLLGCSWSSSSGTLTISTNNISYVSGSYGTNRHAYSANTFDLTQFTSINCSCMYTGSSSYHAYLAYGTAANSGASNRKQSVDSTAPGVIETLTLPMVNQTSAERIYLGNNANSTPSEFYAVWLN